MLLRLQNIPQNPTLLQVYRIWAIEKSVHRLQAYGTLHLEDVIRSKYSSFDAIKKARLEKEKPIVEGFLSWLDQQSPIRGSRMDKAVTYIQNRRSYLSTYLEDGRCSFSNNLSENASRPFTVGRKNWLFCDTPNGAQASAIVYTMVEMAKANGVNVYHLSLIHI